MFKNIVRRIFRPATRRLWVRVDDRIVRQTGPLRADLSGAIAALRDNVTVLAAGVDTARGTVDGLQKDIATLTESGPAMLNAISSQHAMAREARRAQTKLEEYVQTVERRAEFIRKEVLYELRYGGDHKGVHHSIEPRILNREKLDDAGSDIRLNLGCGHILLESHLNVDVREVDGVDVLADVHALPFGPGVVAEIYSAHMLEHFPVEALSRRLLPYWFSVLRPGGSFVAVVKDAEMMLSEYAAGRMTFEDLRIATYGDQEHDGDFHFNMFSRESIADLLVKAGFEDVTLVDTGRRNGLCYEMEVTARRPRRDPDTRSTP